MVKAVMRRMMARRAQLRRRRIARRVWESIGVATEGRSYKGVCLGPVAEISQGVSSML